MPPDDGGDAGARGPAGASEDELVRAFMDERADAIRRVTAWIRAVTGHRAWGFDESEDLVQTTLLALVRNLRAGRFADGDFRAYVRVIAKNICLSSYRRARAHGTPVAIERVDEEAVREDAETTPDAERSATLARVLGRIDGACREIIALAFLAELPRAEIATRLGISEGAARVRLFRCLEKARRSAATWREPEV